MNHGYDFDRANRLLPDGKPRYVRCYDNGGKTADSYTVVFTGRYRQKTGGVFWDVCMSRDPFHPQGIGMRGETKIQIDRSNGNWPPAIGRKCHLGRRISFDDLPDRCRELVLRDYKYLWGLED